MTRRRNREGTIVRRSDGQWAAAVEVDGRRQWVHGRARQDVTRKLQEAIRGAEIGLVPVGDRLTVGQYLERWLEESARRRLRPKTYRGYEQLIRLHLVRELGRVRLSKLGPMQVQQVLNRKLEEGLAPRTVQYMRAVPRAALAQAVRWRLIELNAAALVEGPRVRRPRVAPLTPADARVLLEAVAGDRLEALYVLALGLGLREGEALGLRWDDIVLHRAEVHVR